MTDTSRNREHHSESEVYKELTQVAAIAAAIMEDLRFGQANYAQPIVLGQDEDLFGTYGDQVLTEVAEERLRQDRKWGPQHHDPIVWLAILAEEMGELADAIANTIEWTPDSDPAQYKLVSRLIDAERIARIILGQLGPKEQA